jgi:hypothetical protein
MQDHPLPEGVHHDDHPEDEELQYELPSEQLAWVQEARYHLVNSLGLLSLSLLLIAYLDLSVPQFSA